MIKEVILNVNTPKRVLPQMNLEDFTGSSEDRNDNSPNIQDTGFTRKRLQRNATRVTERRQDEIVELIKQCQRGMKPAQYEICMKYVVELMPVAQRIVNSKTDAETVVQKAFVNAFAHIDRFQGQSPVDFWLKQFVIGQSIKLLLPKGLSGYRWEKVEYLSGNAVEYDERAFSLDYLRRDKEKVGHALQALPEMYRVILVLYVFEGYSDEEIGQLLNDSEEHVRYHRHNARERLATLLR
ncbi:hypothetical protein DYBT9275_05121 [Dyadobacter sp. CECT 9275]|uniref:Sigma-70 family RNA polymerase sigma factor n=2 Tax=Dyadobacter helix TaxID=2822344 RepID=A0A916JJ23_9BACT|nr:hypothetical protein DYBT9275_05121 [Dyadobacter sp. CECT 9275]